MSGSLLLPGTDGDVAPNNIGFRYFPANTIRVPGTFAEVDNSQANSGVQNLRTLIIGQITSGGTANTNGNLGIPFLFTTLSDVITQCGIGSMAALMAQRYRAIDAFGELWILPLADAGGATAAVWSITVTGTATGPGVISLYIGGQLLSVPVATGNTPTQIATAIVAAITAPSPQAGSGVPAVMLPVTAISSAGVVTVTARNGGAVGNDIDIRTNYQGPPFEVLPPGVASVVVAVVTAGATNPSTSLNTALLSMLGVAQSYDFVALPYTDTTSLDYVKAYFSDSANGTWSWALELFGHAFAAFSGTLSAGQTLTSARNDPHVSIMPVQGSPTPSYAWAADITAQCAISQRADPALTLTQLPLNALAPPVGSRFSMSSRDTLLHYGASTFTVDRSGQVYIERMVTTYQTNAAGQVDNSYLDVETMGSLTFVIRNLRIALSSQFGRKKLVQEGNRIPPGSNMVTATQVLLAAVAQYRTLADAGIVQNAAQFAKAALAQNAGSGLVKLMLPVMLANQLRQIAMLVKFTKP